MSGSPGFIAIIPGCLETALSRVPLNWRALRELWAHSSLIPEREILYYARSDLCSGICISVLIVGTYIYIEISSGGSVIFVEGDGRAYGRVHTRGTDAIASVFQPLILLKANT